jgi:hypothetical protein
MDFGVLGINDYAMWTRLDGSEQRLAATTNSDDSDALDGRKSADAVGYVR